MRLLRTCTVAWLLVGMPQTAMATTAAIVSAVEARYQDVTAIQASFSQTVSSPSFGESVQQGALQMMRPTMARWEFSTPTPSEMITNGETMWIYSPDSNQVIVTEDLSSAGGSSDLMSLLTDLSRLDEFFNVTESTASGGSHVLQLIPIDESLKAQLQQLELTLDSTYLLQQVTFEDAFGQQTKLVFSDVQLNPTLDASRFTFTPPAGCTVINTGGL